jgi:hypothetical protein
MTIYSYAYLTHIFSRMNKSNALERENTVFIHMHPVSSIMLDTGSINK